MVARPYRTVMIAAALTAITQSTGAQEVIKEGRYARVVTVADPSQLSPMKTPVDITFSAQVQETVGDAVEHLLLRTGYHVIDHASATDDHRRLMAFPLPEIHRQFRSVSIEYILRALAGDAYSVKVDHAFREVSFQLSDDVQQASLKNTVSAQLISQ